jgi:hypothetical protein
MHRICKKKYTNAALDLSTPYFVPKADSQKATNGGSSRPRKKLEMGLLRQE